MLQARPKAVKLTHYVQNQVERDHGHAFSSAEKCLDEKLPQVPEAFAMLKFKHSLIKLGGEDALVSQPVVGFTLRLNVDRPVDFSMRTSIFKKDSAELISFPIAHLQPNVPVIAFANIVNAGEPVSLVLDIYAATAEGGDFVGHWQLRLLCISGGHHKSIRNKQHSTLTKKIHLALPNDNVDPKSFHMKLRSGKQ